LKIIRQEGVEVEASRLLHLKKGEWLVNCELMTDYIMVTHPRLTKHGAETPKLEYIAPRTNETKRTVSDLAAAIKEALEKEAAEQSELEKAKRKIRDLEKKLEVAEEKARIKLSVKDMLKGDGDSAKLAEELANVKEKYELLKKTRDERNERFKAEIVQLNTHVSQLEKDNDAVEKIKEGLLQLLPINHIPMRNASPGFEPGSREIQLQSTKSVVDVPSVMKPVTINDAAVQGKILTLAKKGLLDKWRKLGEIVKAVIEEGWTVSLQQVNNGLTDLVKQQLIAKKHTDRNYFRLAKNVIFKETEK